MTTIEGRARPRQHGRHGRSAPGRACLVAALVAVLVAPPASAAPAVVPPPPSTGDAWTIDTVAAVDGVPRQFGGFRAVSADDAGNLYVVATPMRPDQPQYRLLKGRVDGSVPLSVFAGTGVGFAGDGGPAATATFNVPSDVGWDAGAVYVADRFNHRIRRIDLATGIVTSVVGSGPTSPDAVNGGFGGDGGPATLARLGQPGGVGFDRAHNLYIADTMNHRVRKVTPGPDGVVDGGEGEVITTVAGIGAPGPITGGDGGPATEARLDNPEDVAVDTRGNVFIVDTNNHAIRKVDTAGTIITFAGDGRRGFTGDGGPAAGARLFWPEGVAVDRADNVFVADTDNGRVRRIDTAGTITTVAGTGEDSTRGDGGPATWAAIYGVGRLHVDEAGHLLVAESAGRVRRVRTALLSMDNPSLAPQVGTPFAYTVRVGALPAAATGLKLTLALAPELTYRRAVSGQCTMIKGLLTCGLGSLARGAVATVVIEVMPTATRATAEAPYAGLPVVSSATLSAKDATAVPYARTVTAHTRISAASCGQVVTRSLTLQGNVGPCEGHGIVVGADGITVDLGDKSVFGFAGPSGDFVADPQRPFDYDAAGILLAPLQPGEAADDVTVTNGTVSHFDAGVAIFRGSRNTVRDLDVVDNVGSDKPFSAQLGDGIVLWESSHNTVEANRLARNGVFDGIGVLGELADHNQIRHNVILDTVGAMDGRPSGQGIIVNASSLEADPSRLGHLFIEGTQIAGNYIAGAAGAGIANVNSICEAGQTCMIEFNTVLDNGDTTGLPCELGVPGRDGCTRIANGIGVQLGPQAQPPAPYSNLTIRFNEVHGNGWHGIAIPGPSVPTTAHPGGIPTSSATGNQVLFNDVSDNATDNNREDLLTCNPLAVAGGTCRLLYDLYDGNPDCAGNIWAGNNWGSGGFNPPCTAVGGVGPPAPTDSAWVDVPMGYPVSRGIPDPLPE